MNCRFCVWFEPFTNKCKHKNWAGYIADPSKPPCSSIAWSINSGLQIIYIPMHIQITDITHRDAEFGFIYSKCWQDEFIFCRYWSKTSPKELRTKANSEATPIWRLVIQNTHPQEDVRKAIKEIQDGN